MGSLWRLYTGSLCAGHELVFYVSTVCLSNERNNVDALLKSTASSLTSSAPSPPRRVLFQIQDAYRVPLTTLSLISVPPSVPLAVTASRASLFWMTDSTEDKLGNLEKVLLLVFAFFALWNRQRPWFVGWDHWPQVPCHDIPPRTHILTMNFQCWCYVTTITWH